MNWGHQTKRLCAWLTLSFAGLLAAGCATPGTGSSTARPGDGLREYQRLVLDLRKDATLTRQAVEVLGASTLKNFPAAYARFDKSLQRLEVGSIKARARVAAMEKRGEAYFEGWREEISGSADQASRRAAEERFAELHGHFETVLKDAGALRQDFRPFLEGVRQLRTTLGPAPQFVAMVQEVPKCQRIAADGRQVDVALDQLLKTLKTAEAAVMAGPLPSINPGDKP
jgi:hypothetical protein